MNTGQTGGRVPDRTELLNELAGEMTAAGDSVPGAWDRFAVVAEITALGVRVTGFRYLGDGPGLPMLMDTSVIEIIARLREVSPIDGGALFDLYVARLSRGPGETDAAIEGSVDDMGFTAAQGQGYRVTASAVGLVADRVRPGVPLVAALPQPPPAIDAAEPLAIGADAAEAPAARSPVAEAADNDAPRVDAPRVDAPRVDAPSIGASPSDAPSSGTAAAPGVSHVPPEGAAEPRAADSGAPDSAEPDSEAADSGASESPAPESPTPESPAPESPAPESPAPQFIAPGFAAPDSSAPEDAAARALASLAACVASWPDLAGDDWDGYGAVAVLPLDDTAAASTMGFRHLGGGPAVPTLIGGSFLTDLRALRDATPDGQGRRAGAVLLRLVRGQGPVAMRFVYDPAAVAVMTWDGADPVVADRLRVVPRDAGAPALMPRPAPDQLDDSPLRARIEADLLACVRTRDRWSSFALGADVARSRAAAAVYDEHGVPTPVRPALSPLPDLSELRSRSNDGWSGVIATIRSGENRVQVRLLSPAQIDRYLSGGPSAALDALRPAASSAAGGS